QARGLFGFNSRVLLLQKSYHKHGPLLIIYFWVKQRGDACWVSRKKFPFNGKFPATGVRPRQGGIRVPPIAVVPRVPLMFIRGLCAKPHAISPIRFADTQPNTLSVWRRMPRFGFHTMSVDV